MSRSNIPINIRTPTSDRPSRNIPGNRWNYTSPNRLSANTRNNYINNRMELHTEMIIEHPSRPFYSSFANPYIIGLPFRNNLDIFQTTLETDNELVRNPNIVLDIDIHTNRDTQTSCSICQDEIELNQQISTLECNHTFHTHCIQHWGEYKQECPLCRHPIPIQ